jgi:hypothetical protein
MKHAVAAGLRIARVEAGQSDSWKADRDRKLDLVDPMDDLDVATDSAADSVMA